MDAQEAAYETSEYRGFRVQGYYGKDGVGEIIVLEGGNVKLKSEVPAYKIWNFNAHYEELIDSLLDAFSCLPVEPVASGHRHGENKEICYCDEPNHSVPGFVVSDPSPLPVDEKFIIWLDDEGDYMIQAQRHDQSQYLTAHCATPEDAVWNMRKILDLAHQLKPVASVELPTQPVADAQGETAQGEKCDHSKCPHLTTSVCCICGQFKDKSQYQDVTVPRSQPETAQGEKCYCSPSGPCIHCYKSERSRQENAPQPQKQITPAEMAEFERGRRGGLCGAIEYFENSGHYDTAQLAKRDLLGVPLAKMADSVEDSQPQPAESDGFEEWWREHGPTVNALSHPGNYKYWWTLCHGLARSSWQASRQSLLAELDHTDGWLMKHPRPSPFHADEAAKDYIYKLEDRIRWLNTGISCSRSDHAGFMQRAEAAEAKLSSLLAQKPEATVSDESLREYSEHGKKQREYAFSAKIAGELNSYRQLFKDDEKGMR